MMSMSGGGWNETTLILPTYASRVEGGVWPLRTWSKMVGGVKESKGRSLSAAATTTEKRLCYYNCDQCTTRAFFLT